MLLRYGCTQPRLVEVAKMEYNDGHGIFYAMDGTAIFTSQISQEEWLRIVSDMFVDGKLSYQGEVTVYAG